MNFSRIFALLFAVGIIAAHANESNLTLTVDGVTYSNVTFSTVTPATVKIFHSSGIARLPLAKLPPELQQRFGYDPDKAGDWQKVEQQKQAVEQQKAQALAKQRAEANRQAQLAQESREEIEKNQQKIWAKIIQVTPNGLLFRILFRGAVGKLNPSVRYPDGSSQVMFLVGHPKQGEFIDGQEIEFNAYQNGNWSYKNTMGAQSTISRWDYVSETAPKK